MAYKWNKVARGIRYREHESRKHGLRPDRYYSIYYSIKGKDYNEGIGWSSDGVKQETCEKLLITLRENQKTGMGPQTYKEMREENLEKQETVKKEKRREEELTLNNIFTEGYLVQQNSNGKGQDTIKNETALFENYIDPFFGHISIKEIDLKLIDKFMQHINSIKSERTRKSLSDATKRHILALLSQIFTYTQTRIDNSLQNPIKLVKKPRSDNQRVRFLQIDEANKLLEELKSRSKETYHIALISLFTGMRASEILKLSWHDVDMYEKSIFIKDPKNKKNRHAHMTAEVFDIMEKLYKEKTNDKVFASDDISKTFSRIISQLEFNKGIDDPRQKVCFHTLRHTFASWHAKAGTPLYTISKLLGHSSIKMTERYAHLCPTVEKQAAGALEGVLSYQKAEVIEFDKVKEK